MRSVGITEWLTTHKARSDARQQVMTLLFDLEGSASASQPELEHLAARALLVAAIRVHLLDLGLPVFDADDPVVGALEVLRLLGAVDPDRADEAWALLDLPWPSEGTEPCTLRVLEYVSARLGQPADRADAIRAWAEAVALLRAVATHAGLAGSDSWYSRAGTSSFGTWSDEIAEMLGDPPDRR